MIIGHQKIWQFLKKSVELNKFPHALLFSGQEKLGKKTLALEFIKFLYCENKEREKNPCQICRSCRDIQKQQHPDLIMIEPEKESIQISQIRNLIWKLSLKPYLAQLKSAILDQAHLMTRDSQGALLKTLEEPKDKTLLILISEYPEMLLSTILSRVQRIKFYPLKPREIKDYLEKKGMGDKGLAEIIKFSLGRPGEIIDFISVPQKGRTQNKAISDFIKISNSDLALRFRYAKDLSEDRQNLKETLEVWLRYFRNNFISIINHRPQKYSLAKLKNILRILQDTNFLISTTNVNPRLALEILMLEL